MKLAQRFLALVCLVLLFIFCVSNGEPMSIRFLNWESPALPEFLLLIFAFLTGVVLTLLWQSLRGISRSGDKKDRKIIKSEIKKPAEPDSVITSTIMANNRLEADQSESADIVNEGEK